MIEIKALSKRFGNFTAVDKLSFTVAEGEVLGFLGPNGAGKSTTMKMLTGFLTPSSGSVSICGFDSQKQSLQARRMIGYLPEGAPGYGDMSVRDFLKFVAKVRQIPVNQIDAAIAAVVEKIRLSEVLQQSIDTLSKGFKRRVGLAQAILHDPKVLILDEPTDGLDPNQKHQVRELIRNLAQDKIVIVSTHILEEVSAVCSRAIIIDHGRLLVDDTPAGLEARSRYHGAVTVKAPGIGEVEAAFGDLPGVAAVEMTDDNVLTALPQSDVDIYTEVQQLLAAKSLQVEEIFQEKGRLDEVFRSLTGGAA